jgi:choline dehydrogenase
MAWPLIFFLPGGCLAHFGISPPPYGDGEVTITPNCMTPKGEGFRAEIRSTDPLEPIPVIFADNEEEFQQLACGVRSAVNVMDDLQRAGLVGKRIQPTDQQLKTDVALKQWIRAHAGTAFHWQGTCAMHGTSETAVVDSKFRVRGVSGLRVGSAAVLPRVTEANPHLTISAFAVALAYKTLDKMPPRYATLKNRHF